MLTICQGTAFGAYKYIIKVFMKILSCNHKNRNKSYNYMKSISTKKA